MNDFGQAADAANEAILETVKDLGVIRNLLTNIVNLGQIARSFRDAYPEGASSQWVEMVRELEESRATLTSLRAEQDGGRTLAAEALEIRRLSALLETERSKIVDNEDDEINRLRVELDKTKRELQFRERQATLDDCARKHQDELSARARAEHHAEMERLSLRKAKNALVFWSAFEACTERDVQDQEAKGYSARARVWKAKAEDRDKWRKACRKMADLLEGLMPEVGDIYDTLIDALRARVQGGEGLRGVLDFLNWSRERYLVVGDLTGWIDAWQSDGSFDSAINILGSWPPNAATFELIFPVAPLIDEVEEDVRYWRSRIELALNQLRSQSLCDQNPSEPGVAISEETKESRDRETSTASDSWRKSFVVPQSRSRNLERGGTLLAPEDSSSDREYVDINSSTSEDSPAGGVAAAPIDMSRKRRVSSSRARNKPKRSKAGGGASDLGKRLALPKPPRAVSSSVFRARDVPQSIVNAKLAMMETKPWERYFDLPSIFPVERSNTTTIAVDEALKTFWQKRGREVFDRWFYLKLEGACDKYGSLDQIAGPLELVLASLMVADKGVSDQHLSPIAYLCAPRHQWPMVFKTPICLRTMYHAHGGGDQGERVVLGYLKEAREWFPKVPAFVRRGDELQD
ncbi:hypothetical protein LEN26_001836 [Aphanomyces euteiches]|nr:hypothetical protein LEN26_001836 [Aphanomyces euteiches]